jgi:uncharacterized protein YbaA (DUF1428 family)
MTESKYSKAQKKSARKWDAANLDRVSVAIPRGRKDAIRERAAAQGESMNGFINAAIDSALSPQDAPQCAVSDFPAMEVSEEDAERINAHTERTGETIEVFIRRAIADTIKRDAVLLKMGMNPAQEQG